MDERVLGAVHGSGSHGIAAHGIGSHIDTSIAGKPGQQQFQGAAQGRRRPVQHVQPGGW
ncbi:hypothetical protein SVIOM74S_02209 [Streptomyces violarus]